MGNIILHAIVFALLSAIFIVAGGRSLITKRPFIVSKRWSVALTILGFMPMMAEIVEMPWPKYPEESSSLVYQYAGASLYIGVFAMIQVVVLYFLRGYLVFGITREGLHNVLCHALYRLNLPGEESDQAFHLPTLNDELLVHEIPLDGGIFGLQLKKFSNRRVIQRLSVELDYYFRTAAPQTRRRGSYGLVWIGVLVLLVGSWLTYSRLSSHAEIQARHKANPQYYMSSEK